MPRLSAEVRDTKALACAGTSPLSKRIWQAIFSIPTFFNFHSRLRWEGRPSATSSKELVIWGHNVQRWKRNRKMDEKVYWRFQIRLPGLPKQVMLQCYE